MRYFCWMRFVLLFACWTFVASPATSAAATANPDAKLTYIFSPDLSGSVPTLHVVLTFEGTSSGSSTLILPTTWAGERDLFRSVKNLHSLESAVSLSATDNPGEVLLRYPPNQKVRVTYDLVTDWTGGLHHPKEFRALVTTNNVIFNGQNGLVNPPLAQDARVSVTFGWRNLPANWKVASSFGAQNISQKFKGQWSRVHDALFVAGDFRFTYDHSSGEHLILAARSSWLFSDREAIEEIANIFRVEREFWGEHKPSEFLVVLVPFDQDLGSSDGTAFTDSVLLYLSRKQTFLTDEKSILAHEIFHSWNPYRMGIASGDETQWFTEGFTRYYQDRILQQARLVDYPDYLTRLNRIIAVYWSSPARNWTQDEWLARKATNNDSSVAPYSRGTMIALWLDQRIRQESGGRDTLDERMFSLVRSKPDVHLTTDYLLSMLDKAMQPQDVAALRSFVVDGATVPLPEKLVGDCGELKRPEGSNPYYVPAPGPCEVRLASQISK